MSLTSVKGALDELGRLSAKAEKQLSLMGEYLWMYSNPPAISSEEEVPIARFFGDKAHKTIYRQHLADRYGKRMQLYSGIHFNYSFSERCMHRLARLASDKGSGMPRHLRTAWERTLEEGSGAGAGKPGGRDLSRDRLRAFSDRVYFHLLRMVSSYSWLPVLLTAASPVYDRSLEEDGLSGPAFDGFSSRRSGAKGYWNTFVPVLDYSSMDSFIESALGYIGSGAIAAESELYLPVRLKSNGVNSLRALRDHGVNHIELRMFDLNPLACHGIFAADLEFAHALMVYLLFQDGGSFTADLQKQAILDHQAAALYDLKGIRVSGEDITLKAEKVLSRMEAFYGEGRYAGQRRILENIRSQRAKITENRRYCIHIREGLEQEYQERMTAFARIRGKICANSLDYVLSEKDRCRTNSTGLSSTVTETLMAGAS